ncbi:MAG: TRAP transporter substrate-binding protein DctP [Acetobacteraceae bacterium]|nr:TRAP transporter substrate-binding protein DctP [Acetobacteraceae bacterium]
MTAADPAPASSNFRRRTLLRAAGLGALAGLAAPGLVARAAPGPRVLKMGYVYGRDSQLGAGAGEFSRKIETATGGAFRVEEYPSGVLGGEVELLDGLRKGEVDVAIVTSVVFSDVVPEFGAFDLPFLFHDAAHARAVLDGPIGQEYLGKFRGHGLVALAWGETGMRHLTNSKCPVRAPADLRGLRMRVPQSEVMLRCFRQLGVDATPLGFPALYGALESGRFDGQENPIETIRAAHFDRVQRYLTLSGHIYCSAIILAGQDCWDDLTPVERDAFVVAGRAGGLVSREVAERADRQGVDALRAAGMEVVPSVDRDAFLAALEPAWSSFAEQFGTALIARMRAQP